MTYIHDAVIFVYLRGWYPDDKAIFDNWCLWTSTAPYFIGDKISPAISDEMTSDSFSMMTMHKTFTNKEKWRGIVYGRG